MFNTVLTAFLAATFMFLLLVTGVMIVYVIGKRAIQRFIAETFTPSNPDSPSRFAAFINQILDLGAKHIVAHAKATILGMQSVDARNEVRQNEAGNPLIAILGSFLPKKIARSLGTNPAVNQLVMNYISKAALNKAGDNNGHKEHDQVQQVFPFK